MTRSTEQQVFFDKFVEFLKKYKGKNVDTATLAAKVEEIWGDTLSKDAAGKLSDLRRSNPEIFKNIKITYTIAGTGPWNKAWKNDPEFRKFFKGARPGVKWEDITAAQRNIKSNTWKSYLLQKERSKVIPKNYIRQNNFADKVGINRDTLGTIRTINRYKNLNSQINKVFNIKKFKEEVWFPDPSKKEIEKFKSLVKENRDAGHAEMAVKKRAGSVEPIKALHRELIKDVDATPRELAKAIYGESNSRTLKHIGNDASKYTEVLLGSRKVSGLIPPSVKVAEDILGNILNRGGFFNWANAERRNSMLMERDRILNTKGPTLATLRKQLVGPGKHLDEAMGVSATYERAPGYTELAQKIPAEINILKGNTIDRDFSVLFEKVIDGKEGSGSYRGTPYKNLNEHIKLFNKYSKNFQKEWKVDTPIIEYKPGEVLDPSKFVKHFDKLSPEARVNVTQLAEKGIGLRSRAMPMIQMLSDIYKTSEGADRIRIQTILGCRRAAASGGRIGFATGTLDACVNTKLTNQTLESSQKIVAGIEEGATGVLGKIKNVSGRFLGTLGKFGARAAPLAALAAVGAGIEPLVRKFVIDDPTTYLTNESQMKGMLLATIEGETPKVDEEILKWQYPGLGAATLAGAVPGAGELYKARRGVGPTGPIPGVGKARAALGIKGVLGKALGATFSPLAGAATLPLTVAAQRKGGTEWGDIATDPMNWMTPAFASSGC